MRIRLVLLAGLLAGLATVLALNLDRLSPFVASESGAASVSWADKLTAVGTIGAVVVSLALAGYGAWSAHRDRRIREFRERLRVERKQAEGVHWWHQLCNIHPLPYDDQTSTEEIVASLGFESCWGEMVVVENTSDAPIHDVVLYTPSYLLIDDLFAFPDEIGPRDRRTFHVTGYGTSLLDAAFNEGGNLSFTDAAGRRWRREQSGELHTDHRSSEEVVNAFEGMRWKLYRTLVDSSRRGSIRSGLRGQEIRELATFVMQHEDDNRPQVSRLVGAYRQRGDRLAFKALQTLPKGTSTRRAAEAWWEWRSGDSAAGALLREAARW